MKGNFEIDLTVDGELGGLADPPGGDVLRDAGVVGCVGAARLDDDEVSGAGDEEVAALPHGRPVPQPRHRRGRLSLGRVAPHLHLAAQRHLPRVRRRLELPPQV